MSVSVCVCTRVCAWNVLWVQLQVMYVASSESMLALIHFLSPSVLYTKRKQAHSGKRGIFRPGQRALKRSQSKFNVTGRGPQPVDLRAHQMSSFRTTIERHREDMRTRNGSIHKVDDGTDDDDDDEEAWLESSTHSLNIGRTSAPSADTATAVKSPPAAPAAADVRVQRSSSAASVDDEEFEEYY